LAILVELLEHPLGRAGLRRLEQALQLPRRSRLRLGRGREGREESLPSVRDGRTPCVRETITSQNASMKAGAWVLRASSHYHTR